jgi:hypothetical protein
MIRERHGPAGAGAAAVFGLNRRIDVNGLIQLGFGPLHFYP